MHTTISLCVFAKNEEHCINHMINSVYDFVDEVIVVDTGSTDKTIDNLKGYKKARIYKIGFTDFASMRTLASHLCRCSWVLSLDADETLENPEILFNLTQHYQASAYAFPRYRWLDLEKEQQTELEAFPDYQVRLYRNNTKFTWRRELHEYFDGAAVINLPEDSPIYINHFQDVYKDEKRKQERDILYQKLAKIAHVEVIGGKSCQEI